MNEKMSVMKNDVCVAFFLLSGGGGVGSSASEKMSHTAKRALFPV